MEPVSARVLERRCLHEEAHLRYNPAMTSHLNRAWRSGSTGWTILTIGVLSWNATHANEGEMLSTAFARGMRHRTFRWAVAGAWITVSLHLFNMLPNRIDPLARLGSAFERRT
jgi:hypothetical protein